MTETALSLSGSWFASQLIGYRLSAWTDERLDRLYGSAAHSAGAAARATAGRSESARDRLARHGLIEPLELFGRLLR